jgi:transcriptional regulator with XRE-family HTH domain
MSVTLGQAMRLTRLRREGLTVPELAQRMGISVGAVIEVHRALALPTLEVENEGSLRIFGDAKARAAERESWPMKWQQRNEKRKR